MSNSKFVFANLILITALLFVISSYIAVYADSVADIMGYFFAVAIVPILITLAASSGLFTVTKQDLSVNKRYLVFALPVFSIVCFQILVYMTLQHGQH